MFQVLGSGFGFRVLEFCGFRVLEVIVGGFDFGVLVICAVRPDGRWLYLTFHGRCLNSNSLSESPRTFRQVISNPTP